MTVEIGFKPAQRAILRMADQMAFLVAFVAIFTNISLFRIHIHI